MSTRRAPNRTATRAAPDTAPLLGYLATIRGRHSEISPREGLLGILSRLHRLAAAVESAEIAAVALARSMGRSWTEIGDALGVSRQAAQQRFGKHLE